MLELSVNVADAYFHNYAIMRLRNPESEFVDSKIEYYELDSSSHGPSILSGGEVIP
jgi:hypothetical protein